MLDRTFPIVSKLGGPEAALRKLGSRGHVLRTKDAIRMWLVRGRIPGDAAVALMRIAETENIPYSADDFSLTEGDAPPRRQGRSADSSQRAA